MPNHKTHDAIAFGTTVPVGTVAAAVLVVAGSSYASAAIGGALFGVSYLASSWWLSPDLDTNSAISRRWGPLRFVWLTYEWAVPHRSALSHSGISALLRVLYLLAWLALLLVLAGLVLPDIQVAGNALYAALPKIALAHPRETLLLLGGAVLADVAHVAADLLSTESKAVLRQTLPRPLYRWLVK